MHVLAQGGAIHFERLPNGKIKSINCVTRDGLTLADCDLPLFNRLLKRRFIKSTGGRPYRATRLGISSVNAQHDNR